MADIKTRDTSKGTIKTINKAAVATERMKKAYVMTKDKAEHSTNASENSAEECRQQREVSIQGIRTNLMELKTLNILSSVEFRN